MSNLKGKEYKKIEDIKHIETMLSFGMQENLQFVWNMKSGQISKK